MIAIILVNYNGSDNTIECISSLTKCTYKDVKIIVVDNFSTDNSIIKLKNIKNIYNFEILMSNENNGFSAGNNIGIKYALNIGADFVLLLNNDTLVEPDFLEKLLSGFSENPKCGATIGKIYYEKNRSTIWYGGGSLNLHTARTKHWNYGKKDTFKNEISQRVTFATGCCLCLSKQLIENIGLLDENYFLYEEDAEYSCRIIRAGYDIVYVPDAVIYHKVNASTGAASPMIQYYSIRNKYIMIQHHFKGINKISAYFCSTLQMLYRCVKKELQFKYYVAAIKAFLRNETGKVKDLNF